MLVRHLPRDSALVSELNDNQPVWSNTEHLLADLWALLVKAHSDPKKTPDNIDHPARAAMVAKAKAATKKRLKVKFLARKQSYSDE